MGATGVRWCGGFDGTVRRAPEVCPAFAMVSTSQEVLNV